MRMWKQCNRDRSWWTYNKLSAESAAPLGFTELYINFQLIVELSDHNFTVLVHSHRNRRLFSAKKLLKPTAHYLLSIKRQTDTLSDKLVNIVEHLAAKESNISLRS